MRRVASTAGPRSSTTSLRRSARRTRRPARSGTSSYRDVEPAAADRFPGDERAAAGRHGHGQESPGMAAREMGGEARPRRSDRNRAIGRGNDDPRVPARRARRRGGAAAGGGPVQPARVARIPADRRARRLHPRSGVDHARSELGGDAEDLCRVPRPDRVRRAIADPLPRDQPGLAGERSRACRDHDGVRGADGRGAGRRIAGSSTA